MSTKIVIIVSGGNVQGVYTDYKEEIDVIMLDYDNITAGDELTDKQKEAEGNLAEMTMIY